MVAAAITLEEEDEIMVIAQTSLWYIGGKSDKVYVITAIDTNGVVTVKAEWGRRGKTMQSQIKVVTSRPEAMNEFYSLRASKVAKGYRVVASASTI